MTHVFNPGDVDNGELEIWDRQSVDLEELEETNKKSMRVISGFSEESDAASLLRAKRNAASSPPPSKPSTAVPTLTQTTGESTTAPVAGAGGLKGQEKWMDELNKENFGLKLKIYFLEEKMGQLQQLQNWDVHDALRQNVDLQVQTEQLKAEIDQYKRQFKEQQADWEQAQRARQQHQHTLSADQQKLSAELEALRQDNLELKHQVKALQKNTEHQQQQHQQDIHITQRLLAEQRFIDEEKMRLSMEAKKLKELEQKLLANNHNNNMNMRPTSSPLHSRQGSASSQHMLDSQVNDLRHSVRQLEEERIQLQSVIRQHQMQLSQRQVELDQMKSENASLKLQVDQQQFRAQTASPSFQNMSFSLNEASFRTTDSTLDSNHQNFQVNQQLEHGISLLRDQLSELKLQLIEKSSNAEQLSHELSSRNDQHRRSVEEIRERHLRDEAKWMKMMDGLKAELDQSRREVLSLQGQLDCIRQDQQVNETQMQIEAQGVERQLALKNSRINQLTDELERTRHQLKTLESSFTVKEQHTEKLAMQLETKQRLLAESEVAHGKVTEQLKQQVDQLTKQLKERQNTISQQNLDINAQQEQSAKLRKELLSVGQQLSQKQRTHAEEFQKLKSSMDQEILQFQQKYESAKLDASEREVRIQELEVQLEMHSVGMEASVSQHIKEKETAKHEVHILREENSSLKLRFEHVHGELNEMKLAFQEAVTINEQMALKVQAAEEKMAKQRQQSEEIATSIRRKDEELREKIRLIREMEDKLQSLDSAMSESHHMTEMVEQRVYAQVEERDKFLMKIQEVLLQLAHDELFDFEPFSANTPQANFYLFSEQIYTCLKTLKHVPEKTKVKVSQLENRLKNEISVLNKKLEQKSEELTKFEKMLHDSVEIQNKMKGTLSDKTHELETTKSELYEIRHQLAAQQHELTSLQSTKTLLESSDKGRHLDLLNQISDLQNQLQTKTSLLDEVIHAKQEITQQLEEERVSNRSQLQTVTEQLQLARREVEMRQEQLYQLESALQRQRHLQRSHSNQTLMAAADHAQTFVHSVIREELNESRKQLEEERRLREHQLEDQRQLQQELAKVKRKLERREHMIAQALSKLEMINHRKGSMERLIWTQFKDEMRKVMTTTSMDSVSGQSSTQPSG